MKIFITVTAVLISVAALKIINAFTAKRALKNYAALEQKANSGDEKAMYEIAMLFYQNTDKAFLPAAFKWALTLAQKGADSGIMLQVADMYLDGIGTTPDKAQALYWYQKALEADLRAEKSIIGKNGRKYSEEQIKKLS